MAEEYRTTMCAFCWCTVALDIGPEPYPEIEGEHGPDGCHELRRGVDVVSVPAMGIAVWKGGKHWIAAPGTTTPSVFP